MSQSARLLLRAAMVPLTLAVVGTLNPAPQAQAQPSPEAGAKAASTTVLSMTFNSVAFAGPSTLFVNGGTATLSMSVASSSGGTIREGPGRVTPATNKSVRTPAFNPTAAGARAVIRVVDRIGADDLNPGTAAFTFGADFVLDATSEQAGSSDNGDNLIQRGLFGNRSQYKIQVDHKLVSCRVKGTQGFVNVVSPVAISAGRWYRARCSRTGSAVTLAVSRWSASGVAVTTSTSRNGATGSLTPAASTVPLSIGGKLYADGQVLETADQFNGRIDNTVLYVG